MAMKQWKDSILKNISKLNAMNGHSLYFGLEEKDGGLFLVEYAPDGKRFGIFEPYVLFEDYVSKEKAYQSMDTHVAMLVAGTKLCDPAAYHNHITIIKGE
jgi:hypothetical protein